MKIPIDWIAIIGYAAIITGVVLRSVLFGVRHDVQMSNSIAIYGGVVVLACIGYCKWKKKAEKNERKEEQ